MLRKEAEYKKKQKNAAEERQHTAEHEEKVRTILLVSTAIDAVAAKQEADHKQNKRHERGKAAREWVTIIAISFTAAFALGTLIVTHLDTDRLIKEAKIASDQQHSDTSAAIAVAQQANGISQDMASRQLRAYVYVKPPAMGVTGLSAGDVGSAVIAIRNSGQTPAYHVSMRGNFGFGPYPIPKNQAWIEGPYGGDIAINPETETSTGGIVSNNDSITKNQIDSIADGKNYRFYLFGSVKYYDIYGIERTSEYCFSYFGNGPVIVHSDICDQHNSQNW
jgi:hypothetical protein